MGFQSRAVRPRVAPLRGEACSRWSASGLVPLVRATQRGLQLDDHVATLETRDTSNGCQAMWAGCVEGKKETPSTHNPGDWRCAPSHKKEMRWT